MPLEKFPTIFIKNIDFQDLLERFMISAVAAILGIRLFLKLTNYPQLTPRGLHIAHMLWGGLLMLLAIFILLFFLGRKSKQLAAMIAGLGFGIFIDELGKFITKDNNYFYQPTAAIIYVLFVFIYLVASSLKKSYFSDQERLINSLELLKEAVIDDLSEEEKRKGLHSLTQVKNKEEIYRAVKILYQRLETIPVKPNIFSVYTSFLKNFYHQLIHQKWFTLLVNLFFLFQAIGGIFTVIFFIFGTFSFFSDQLSLSDFLSLAASMLSAIFVIYGVSKMHSSRLLAYKQFKRSILISILLVQVFVFYKDQFSAFFGLVFDLLILVTLNYMIEREKRGA